MNYKKNFLLKEEMIKRFILLISLVFTFVICGFSQVTEVKFKLVYDTARCNFDVWLHIVSGQAVTLPQRAQFNSSVSLVVPTGTIITVDTSYAPFIGNNLSNPHKWGPLPNNSCIAPAVTPQCDYLYFTTTLNPVSYYPQVFPGDSLRLFGFKADVPGGIINCAEKIRLFKNYEIQGVPVAGGDPNSTFTCSGDFNNGFTMGSGNQLYIGALDPIRPPSPLVENKPYCSFDGIAIDLQALDSTKCKGAYSYQWTGPGYTSTNQDVFIPASSNPTPGNYEVIVSDTWGCKDTFNFNVDLNPNGGQDISACGGSTINLIGNPTSGMWQQPVSPPNPPGITGFTPSGNFATVNLSSTANFIYKFLYSVPNSTCVDTVKITASNQDAGPDPADQDCYTTAVVSLNAISNTGIWEFVSGPGTPSITNPNQKSTTVTGFPAAGTYVFQWKNGICVDNVEVTIGTCTCPIDNVIIQPTVQNYCGGSGLLNIVGQTQTPAGGVFKWKISDDGVTFNDAPVPNGGPNYTTQNITTPGTYYFQREYSITTPFPCTELSNTVVINVYPTADSGPDQADNCAVLPGGSVIMNATGVGSVSWSIKTTPPGGSAFIVIPTFAGTEVNQFSVAGTYTLTWTDDNGCKDDAQITITERPKAGPDKELKCVTFPTSTTMSASGPGSWTIVPGNPSVVNITNLNNANTTITNFTQPGNYFFIWGSPTCHDSIMVTVSGQIDAGPNQLLNCIIPNQGTVITDASEDGGTWTLTKKPTSGALVSILGANSKNAQLIGFTEEGVYTFFYTLTNGCSDSLRVTVITKKSAGPDKLLDCTDLPGGSVPLNAFGTGTFTLLPGSDGTATINPNNANGTISNFSNSGDYYLEWTANGCKDTMLINVKGNPDPGTNKTVDCIPIPGGGGSVTMNAVGAGTWSYGTNTFGSTIVNVGNPNTEINDFKGAGTYTYQWTVNGCTKSVNVIVTAKPQAGNDKTITCVPTLPGGSVPMTASGVGTWTKDLQAGTSDIAQTNNPFTLINNFGSEGTYKYIWTTGTCSDTVAVNVTAVPKAGPDQNFTCVNLATFEATMAADGTSGIWTKISGPNINAVVIQDVNSPTTKITGLSAGTSVFEWERNGCKDQVSITLTQAANAGATPLPIECFVGATGQAILNANGISGNWVPFVPNPGNAVLATPLQPSTTVTFPGPGTYKFVWISGGCQDTVAVDVDDECPCLIMNNNITGDREACQQSGPFTISEDVANPTTPAAVSYMWEVSVNGGNWQPAVPSNTKNYISPGVTVGEYRYRRIVKTTTGFICGDTSNTITINVKAKPNAGSDQTLPCITLPGGSIGVIASGTVGVWTALNGGSISSPSSNVTTLSNFPTAGTYPFVWTVEGCPDTMRVIVTEATEAGPDKELNCVAFPAGGVMLDAIGIGTWSQTGLPATVAIGPLTNPKATVSNITQAGVYKLYWTNTSGCKDSMNLTVTAKPNAGPDKNKLCVTLPTTETLSAVGSGTWNSLSGATVTNGTNPNSTVTSLDNAGMYLFEWNNNGCKDTMMVNVTEAANAGPNQTDECFVDFNTSIVGNGSGTWAVIAPNTSTFTPSGNTANLTFSGPGVYKYTYTLAACKDTVTVTVDDDCPCLTIDNAIDPPSPQDYCISSPQVTITGLAASPAGVYQWQIANGTNGTFGTALGVSINQNYTTQILPVGTYKFRRIFTTTQGFICKDTSNEVVITVNPKPNAGPDLMVPCAFLPGGTVNANAVGTGIWSQINSGPTIVLPNTNNTAFIDFPTEGDYKFVWTEKGCTDTINVKVTQGVDAGPGDQLLCVTLPTTISLNAVGTGNWVTNLIQPSGIVSYSNPNDPNAVVSNITVPGFYTFKWQRNGCDDIATFEVTQKMDAGGPINLNCINLPGGQTPIVATNSVGLWKLLLPAVGSVNIAAPNSNTTNASQFTKEGLYELEWTSQGCSDTLQINVTAKPNAGLNPPLVPCYITDVANINADASTGPGEWIIISGGSAIITDEMDPTTTVTNFSGAGTYRLVWRTNNNCEDTITITVGNNCPCQISNKDILTPNPNTFCNNSGNVTITGIDALPVTGFYTWQYSLGNSKFELATGINNDRDYTTIDLTVGTHRFRRLYTTTSLPICTDSSNIVTIIVNPNPDAGPDITSQCIELNGTSFLMNASGTFGQWAQLLGPSINIFGQTNPKATFSDFTADGTYLFEWIVNGCSDSIEVFVSQKADAGADSELKCIELPGGTTNLSAIGVGQWTKLGNSPFVNNNNDPNTSVGPFTEDGIFNYEWKLTNGCTDSASIKVSEKPNPGSDFSITCVELKGGNANLNAEGNGKWTFKAAQSAGAVTIANDMDPKTAVSNFTKEGNYFFDWEVNGCKADVIIAVTEKAKVKAASKEVKCFVIGSTLLEASGTGQWTLSSFPVGGIANILLPGDSTTVVDGFTMEGTYIFTWRIANGCEEIVTVQVGKDCDCPIDKNNIIQPTGSFCGNSGILSLQGTEATPAGTYLWQYSFNAPVLFNNAVDFNTGQNYTTRDLPVGDHRFRRIYTTKTAPICSDTSNVILIKVNAKPTAGIDKTVPCVSLPGGSINMTATGIGGSWSVISGNASIVNNGLANSLVNNFINEGIVALEWDVNGCKDTVSINVTEAANAGTSQNIDCITLPGGEVTMNAIGVGVWSEIDTTAFNKARIINTSNASTKIDGFKIKKIYSFEWTRTNGCKDTTTVNVTPKADGGSNVNVQCFLTGSAVLTGTGIGTWDELQGNPSITTLTVQTASNSVSVSGFGLEGTYKYVWTDDNNCTDTVDVVVGKICNCVVTSNTISPVSKEYCEGETVIVNLNGSTAAPANGTYQWQYRLGNGNFANAGGSSTNEDYTTLNLGLGTHSFRRIYSITTPTECMDTSNIIIIKVNPKPNVGADITLSCINAPGGSTIMNGVGTGNWSKLAGGVVSIAVPTSGNTVINNFGSTGQYIFEWEQNGCRDTVNINVQPGANAGPNISVKCFSKDTAILAASGSGTWLGLGSASTLTIINGNTPNAIVKNFPIEGSYSFEWTDNNGCKDTIVINVGKICDCDIEDNTLSPTNFEFCFTASNSVNLTGTAATPSGGTYTWMYRFNAVGNFTNLPSSNVQNYLALNLAVGTHEYRRIYNITSPVACADTSNIVTVTIRPKPNVGGNLSVKCFSEDSIALNASGTGRWKAIAGAFSQIVDTNNPKTIVKNFASLGAFIYEWTDDNGCKDTVAINVGNDCGCLIDNNTIISPNQEFCEEANLSVILDGSVATPSGGTYQWIYRFNDGAIIQGGADENYTMTNLVVGEYKVGRIYSITNPAACTDTSDFITITVKAKPNLGADLTLNCVSVTGGSVTLPGSGIGEWRIVSGGDATFEDKTKGNSLLSNFTKTGTTYILEWTQNGCTDELNILVNPGISAGSDVAVKCFSKDEAILSATAGTGSWKPISGPSSTIVSAGSSNTIIKDFASIGIYEYEWTNAVGCKDTVRVSVGGNCDCEITGNNLLTPTTVAFCDTAKQVIIDGLTPSPLGGIFEWQTNFNNLGWNQAADVFNTEDYTAKDLLVGNHKFRRIYSIQGQNPCKDTSNIVSLDVNKLPNLGLDRNKNCITLPGGSEQILNTGNAGIWTQQGPASVVIENSGTTTTIKDFASPGIYKFSFLQNGCEDTITISVTEAANAGIDKSISCVTIPGGSITMTANPGLSNLTKKWTPASGQGNAFITNVNSPTTTITGFDKEGIYKFTWAIGACTDEVEVNVMSKVSGGNDATVQCYKLQSATLSAVSLGGTWTIITALSDGTATIANPADNITTVSNFSKDGTYYFEWKVGNCSDTIKVEALNNCTCVVDNNSINTPNGSFCVTNANTVIDGDIAAPPGGTYKWQYRLNGGSFADAPPVNTNEDYITASLPIGRNEFRRIYILGPNCEDTTDVTTINIVSKPAKPTITAPLQLCEGQNLKFTIKDSIGYVYQWNGPNGFNSTLANPSISNVSLLASGQYKMVIKIADCESDTALFNVTVNPSPAKPNLPNVSPSCEGQGVTITGPTLNGASYQWNGPGGKTFTTKDVVINPLTSQDTGNYRLVVTVNGCPSQPAVTKVSLITKPKPTITSVKNEYCEGEAVKLSVPNNTQETYKWTSPKGTISTSNEINIVDAKANDAGIYKLIVSRLGCESDTVRFDLKINASPLALPLTNYGPVCEGGNISINAEQKNGITYKWIGPNGNLSNTTNTITLSNVKAQDKGSYKLYIVDAKNCKSDTSVTTVDIKIKPNVSALQNTLKCFNTDTTTISTTDSETGSWKAITNGVIIQNPNSKSTKVYGFVKEGNYTFEWSNGTCTETVTIFVDKDCPCKVFTNEIEQPDPAVFCETSDAITIIGNAVEGDNITYLWQVSKDKTNFTNASGLNNSQNYLTDKLPLGIYEFRRISRDVAIASCVDTSEVVLVTVVDKTKLGIVLDNFNNPNCIGDSININLTNPIFKAKYIWSAENSLTIITKVDSIGVSIKGNASGSHKVFVTIDAKGCETAIPAEANVIIRPNPFINLGLDTTFCSLDGEYELKAEGFESVTWDDGSEEETFIVKEKGLYSVTVVDTFGCTSTDEIRIKEFCCKLFAPNIIMLGTGGQNEEFFIEDNGCVIKSKIRIYDRWGNLMYISEEGKKPWDGLFNGVHVEQGVYAYIYEYTALDEDEKEFKGKLSGDLTIIRKK